MITSENTELDWATGEVRLVRPSGTQLLFRITQDGIMVWDRMEKRERLIPWPTFLRWVATVTA